MNTLYPLKFNPILKEMIWGGKRLKEVLNKESLSDKIGESWELSGVEGNISVVANGFLKGNTLEEIIEIYMGDLLGEKVYEKFGLEFPLLIKFIDANDALSIQVHPDDKLAAERHQSFGKTEMWYVLDHEPEAELIVGFNQVMTKDKYVEALNNGKIKDILNSIKVNKGDVFFLPAGRVHAIGAGMMIAEIQQTSNITYRIYDWDRVDSKGNARELHTDLAVDAIDYSYIKDYTTPYKVQENKTVPLLACEYFSTQFLKLNQKVEKDYTLIDSFVIYMALEGAFTIIFPEGEEIVIKGETVLIPADLKFITIQPQGEASLLEVYIK